jgi:hypothetical protein
MRLTILRVLMASLVSHTGIYDFSFFQFLQRTHSLICTHSLWFSFTSFDKRSKLKKRDDDTRCCECCCECCCYCYCRWKEPMICNNATGVPLPPPSLPILCQQARCPLGWWGFNMRYSLFALSYNIPLTCNNHSVQFNSTLSSFSLLYPLIV